MASVCSCCTGLRSSCCVPGCGRCREPVTAHGAAALLLLATRQEVEAEVEAVGAVVPMMMATVMDSGHVQTQ